MTEEKPQELLIIKRYRGGSEAGHGGAWKIAFADFMTAMMALFLVLWLISATNEKTKASLARYFNPVKLVDMTIQKRGLNDPAERSTEDAVDNAPPPSKSMSAPKKQPVGPTKPGGAKPQRGAGANYQPTHSEAALFRDPYAVLAEIAASGSAIKTPDTDQLNHGAGEKFQDPFQAAAPQVPQSTPPAAQPDAANRTPAGAPATAAKSVAAPQPSAKPADMADKAANAAPAAAVDLSHQKSMSNGAASAASQAQMTAVKVPAKDQSQSQAQLQSQAQAGDLAAENVEMARLRKEIAEIGGKGTPAPAIEVKATKQGFLISLTDEVDYAMFAIGSAEPQRQTLQVMAKIAQILKKEKGTIIISGHTDGRRFRSRTYDNWRLSTARAQMALYMLVRGGFDEKRIESIQGDADHQLKVPNDPLAAANRRIEILLREAKP